MTTHTKQGLVTWCTNTTFSFWFRLNCMLHTHTYTHSLSLSQHWTVNRANIKCSRVYIILTKAQLLHICRTNYQSKHRPRQFLTITYTVHYFIPHFSRFTFSQHTITRTWRSVHCMQPTPITQRPFLVWQHHLPWKLYQQRDALKMGNHSFCFNAELEMANH